MRRFSIATTIVLVLAMTTSAEDLTKPIIFLGSNSLTFDTPSERIQQFVNKESLHQSEKGKNGAPIPIPKDLAADLHVPPSEAFTYYSPEEAKKITFGTPISYLDSMTGERSVSVEIPGVRTMGSCILVRQTSVGSVIRSRIVLNPGNPQRGQSYARDMKRETLSLDSPLHPLPEPVKNWVLNQFSSGGADIIEIWQSADQSSRFILNAFKNNDSLFVVFDEKGNAVTPTLGKDTFWTIRGVYDIDNDGKAEIHFGWSAGTDEPDRFKLLAFRGGKWIERE